MPKQTYKVSQVGIDFIKEYEGFRSQAYQDAADVWTVGYGSTMWDSGVRVKQGDTITKECALKLIEWECSNKAAALTGLKLNQNQVDALLSFIYNLGVGAFNSSTLRKKVHFNPNDPAIRQEFLKWCKARVNGELKVLNGLKLRREREADLYFKPTA